MCKPSKQQSNAPTEIEEYSYIQLQKDSFQRKIASFLQSIAGSADAPPSETIDKSRPRAHTRLVRNVTSPASGGGVSLTKPGGSESTSGGTGRGSGSALPLASICRCGDGRRRRRPRVRKGLHERPNEGGVKMVWFPFDPASYFWLSFLLLFATQSTKKWLEKKLLKASSSSGGSFSSKVGAPGNRERDGGEVAPATTLGFPGFPVSPHVGGGGAEIKPVRTNWW